MTQKINGQGYRPVDSAGTPRSEASKAARQESATGAQGNKAVPSGDTVNVSRSGLLMSRLQEVVRGSPVVDSQRVAAIKEAVASGSYKIDDQRVADKLLRHERNLG
ncbi:MAG TPA: flagellar biosynthesis anti-sigma factor FlgM [Gammaproteobacteria bacterium]|jgi:negative regulator of flagellin synthesis FlgM|nr:flagellar biosynthesis anti-sigma factor FlgM [Gammaproteobacteria bacterium]